MPERYAMPSPCPRSMFVGVAHSCGRRLRGFLCLRVFVVSTAEETPTTKTQRLEEALIISLKPMAAESTMLHSTKGGPECAIDSSGTLITYICCEFRFCSACCC